MNEARDRDFAGTAARLEGRSQPGPDHDGDRRESPPRGPVVHVGDRPVEQTEIRWNHFYETHECIRCHCMLHYDFDFRYCPYCGRTIRRNTQHREGRSRGQRLS